jgi:GNAT superfamily N-acetyltransferase
MARELVTLRLAEPRDVDRLRCVTIAAKAHWGHDLEWVRSWVAAGDFPGVAVARGEGQVLEVDGVVAGWSALQHRGETAWLEDLWVDPQYMGRGFGKTLFLDAAARAVDAGARRLEWEADPDAVGFYERMGGRHVRDSDLTELGRVLPIMALDLPRAPHLGCRDTLRAEATRRSM